MDGDGSLVDGRRERRVRLVSKRLDGVSLVLPSVDAEVSDRVAGRYLACALSLRNSTTFLGRTAGPVAFAGVAATTGYAPSLLVGAIGAVAVAGFVVAGGRSIDDGEVLATRIA